MIAARLHAYGPPDVLTLDTVPDPLPGAGEVLVATHAISLNPVDVKLRAGGLRTVVRWRLPHTTGLDVSGVVAAVGPGVTRFSVGDAVFASCSHTHEGTAATCVVVPEDHLAAKPDALSHREAAALAMTGLTAFDALVSFAHLTAGEHLLVLNGSGGVGTAAIQLGVALGARVSATASPRNHALLAELGATPLDRHQPLPSDLAPDVVLVAAGGEVPRQALEVAPGGARIANLVGDMPRHVAAWGPWMGTLRAGLGMAGFSLRAWLGGRRASHVVRVCEGRHLARLAGMASDGALRAVIDTVYPFEQIVEAHRHVEAGHTVGKVVVELVAEPA